MYVTEKFEFFVQSDLFRVVHIVSMSDNEFLELKHYFTFSFRSSTVGKRIRINVNPNQKSATFQTSISLLSAT